MRIRVVALGAIMLLTIVAADQLPGILDMSEQVVQERSMLVLLPVLLLFLWWVW